METTKQFASITSKLGVHIDTTTHTTKAAADRACRKAITAGNADSAATYDGHEAVSFFGSGR